MVEALHSLHDYPKAQEAASTARQEIALNGTYLRDVILSEFGSVSPDHLLEATDVNANNESEDAISSPGFFVHNREIMDWALRYNRDKPLIRAGDPEIPLNRSQIRAIAQMLSERVSLVQGVSTIHFRVSIIHMATPILASRYRKDADDHRSDPATQEALQSASPDSDLHIYQRRRGQSGRGTSEGGTTTASYRPGRQSERESSAVLT